MMMKKAAVAVASRTAARFVARQVRCASNEINYQVNYRDKTKAYFTPGDSPYSLGKHRSNALELLEKQPIIEVDGEMAICDGGGGSLGHPIEYISLEQPGIVKACIYCGLKYKSKDGGH